MNKIFIPVVTLVLTSTTYAMEISAPKSYELKYVHSFGNINGFVQIPKGGQHGTATEKRPEFKELGIKHVSYPSLSGKMKWNKFAISLDLDYQTFKGTGTIKENLITHNIPLEAGSEISSKHKYAFYGTKAHYDIPITENLTITPNVGAHIFDFSYQFSAKYPQGKEIVSGDKRNFHAPMLSLGFDANYSLNEKAKLIFSGTSNIPFGNIRHYYNTSFMLSYNLYKADNKELNLLSGIVYEKLKFKDSQKEMQNFMEHKIAPIYKVGLEYKF